VRTAPHITPRANPEAEQSVPGAILVRPAVLGSVPTRLKPAHLYREARGCIYKAMLNLCGRGERKY